MKIAAESFWDFVDKKGPLMLGMPTRCWQWLGPLRIADGYGRPRINNKLVYAHRFSWELRYGLVLRGFILHHICLNPGCVNPSHMCQITDSAHKHIHCVIRGTCKNGHPFDEDDPLINGKGYRLCRECAKENRRRFIERWGIIPKVRVK